MVAVHVTTGINMQLGIYRMYAALSSLGKPHIAQQLFVMHIFHSTNGSLYKVCELKAISPRAYLGRPMATKQTSLPSTIAALSLHTKSFSGLHITSGDSDCANHLILTPHTNKHTCILPTMADVSNGSQQEDKMLHQGEFSAQLSILS